MHANNETSGAEIEIGLARNSQDQYAHERALLNDGGRASIVATLLPRLTYS